MVYNSAAEDFVVDVRLGGMVPDQDALPDVLPTDRLLVSGKAVPAVRSELREIPNTRAALAVGATWAELLGVMTAAAWLNNPLMYGVAFIEGGRSVMKLNILGHEAAHRTLFSNRKANDFVGRWVLSYPGWSPFDLYRRTHINHHRDEFGPKEPDTGLYANYPITKASMKRKLVRDATGQSGWRLLKGLGRAAKKGKGKTHARRILGVQAGSFVVATALGHPLMWIFCWFGPYMTYWRVINRLRSISEHGGMTRSQDRRETTHHVEQHQLAKFFMVPFSVGWHLAHHVDMGVPCWNLEKFHAELVESGYVTPAYTWPSYRSLWKALAAG